MERVEKGPLRSEKKEQKRTYYIIDKEALPEVFVQVVQAKHLLVSGKVATVQEAVAETGISRSSFYKYKDMIEPFTDMVHKKVISLYIRLDDVPGVLPNCLSVLQNAAVNILTIHQSIPINGLADVTLSVEVLEDSWDISDIMEGLHGVNGVASIKILARE